jgi:hypothetical protein
MYIISFRKEVKQAIAPNGDGSSSKLNRSSDLDWFDNKTEFRDNPATIEDEHILV